MYIYMSHVFRWARFRRFVYDECRKKGDSSLCVGVFVLSYPYTTVNYHSPLGRFCMLDISRVEPLIASVPKSQLWKRSPRAFRNGVVWYWQTLGSCRANELGKRPQGWVIYTVLNGISLRAAHLVSVMILSPRDTSSVVTKLWQIYPSPLWSKGYRA